MSWYQRLGMGVSLIGLLANVALALGAALVGVIVFLVCAVLQVLGILGYRQVRKKPGLSLFFVWLALEALALSGLLSFFPAAGLFFLILLGLAFVSATGATVRYPISRAKKIVIIGSGLLGVVLIFYLILVVFFRTI